VVSVSADGSTWFLGGADVSGANPNYHLFQYPLMDRLGFWGVVIGAWWLTVAVFQYPLMDRLGFWGSRAT